MQYQVALFIESCFSFIWCGGRSLKLPAKLITAVAIWAPPRRHFVCPAPSLFIYDARRQIHNSPRRSETFILCFPLTIYQFLFSSGHAKNRETVPAKLTKWRENMGFLAQTHIRQLRPIHSLNTHTLFVTFCHSCWLWFILMAAFVLIRKHSWPTPNTHRAWLIYLFCSMCKLHCFCLHYIVYINFISDQCFKNHSNKKEWWGISIKIKLCSFRRQNIFFFFFLQITGRQVIIQVFQVKAK